MPLPTTAPALASEILAAVERLASTDERVIGVTLGGSAVTGGMDQYSDLDFVVVCDSSAHPSVLADARVIARGLGPLLAAFTGEHVGEPRLLIALYGPPLLHVDLKFVTESDVSTRVEDGLVIADSEGALAALMKDTGASWPQPDPQWIEDRFWIWVHYGASKLARGELFECIDMLTYVRSTVLGPLIAVEAGYRPQGVRRIEANAPGTTESLEATLASHDRASCASALTATVALYRELRKHLSLELRHEAESAAVQYLDQISAVGGQTA